MSSLGGLSPESSLNLPIAFPWSRQQQQGGGPQRGRDFSRMLFTCAYDSIYTCLDHPRRQAPEGRLELVWNKNNSGLIFPYKRPSGRANGQKQYKQLGESDKSETCPDESLRVCVSWPWPEKTIRNARSAAWCRINYRREKAHRREQHSCAVKKTKIRLQQSQTFHTNELCIRNKCKESRVKYSEEVWQPESRQNNRRRSFTITELNLAKPLPQI